MTPHPSSGDISALYERHAEAWDKDRGRATPLLERPWLDRFREALAPGLPILDIGCGSANRMAQYLIEQGHAVTGVDTSPRLIDLARSRFPNETWLVADMRALALPDRFSGLLAWDSFFHLTPDDQRAMFPVFAAHATPGAALMFTSGTAFGEAIGSFEGDPLYHASLDEEEYRALLAQNGFSVLSYEADVPACGGHTIWIAKFK